MFVKMGFRSRTNFLQSIMIRTLAENGISSTALLQNYVSEDVDRQSRHLDAVLRKLDGIRNDQVSKASDAMAVDAT